MAFVRVLLLMKQGLEGLQAELKLDMQRLWLRNLGRDDRLIADHGRESRHPFLDEAFTAALLRLPLSAIVDMNLPGIDIVFWYRVMQEKASAIFIDAWTRSQAHAL